MGDPLKELHRQMSSSGYLNDDKKDYKNFVLALQSDDSRKALYDVLKQNGKVSASYEQFAGAMFSDYENVLSQVNASIEVEKKRMVEANLLSGKDLPNLRTPALGRKITATLRAAWKSLMPTLSAK